MAKKKSNKSTLKTLSMLSVIFGIVAVATIVLPAIFVKETDTSYTGLQLAFGYTKEIIGVTTTVFSFSIMNVLAYALVLAGVIFGLAKDSKLFNLISALAFIVGGIFLFMQISFCIPALSSLLKDLFVLSAWSVIAGILAILSGIISFAKIILD